MYNLLPLYLSLVSWVSCDTWLYRFLIFAPLLTFILVVIEILCNYLTLCLLELLNGTLASNEDRDEMPQNAIIHQGLHCLLRSKQSSGTEGHLYLIILTCDSLTYTMDQPRIIS